MTITIGICKRCDAPVTAFHPSAGAAQMHCEHSINDVLWYALDKMPDAAPERKDKE